jgi:hypothetical protein
MRQESIQKKKNGIKKDISKSYSQFKEFEGKKYTGMKVGRTHKWYYDKGEWKEKKVTPDKWQFTYTVTKRRAGIAPEGSGVPLGTEYHWYILANQNVKKIDANSYTSSSEDAQRKRLIEILQRSIEELKTEMIGTS